jgi:hypothetical protein
MRLSVPERRLKLNAKVCPEHPDQSHIILFAPTIDVLFYQQTLIHTDS